MHPTFSKNSSYPVYIDPTRVYNAASYQPITAGMAPGELITLFGSGLYSGSGAYQVVSGGSPATTLLGGVQVLINGQTSPVFFVSPTQVSAILPYATASAASPYATIQVSNGGVLSNVVSILLTDANMGAFSEGQNGIGDAIAEHANGKLVTAANPATPGETIVLALTGMGTVTPQVTDGAVGPSPTLSYADNYNAGQILVFFNDYLNQVYGQQATLSYGGLYPGFAGLYQMNVQVPTTAGPGDVYIELVTDAADVEQVTVCVTGGCTVGDAAATTAPLAQLRQAQVPSLQALQHRKAKLRTSRTPGSRPNPAAHPPVTNARA